MGKGHLNSCLGPQPTVESLEATSQGPSNKVSQAAFGGHCQDNDTVYLYEYPLYS